MPSTNLTLSSGKTYKGIICFGFIGRNSYILFYSLSYTISQLFFDNSFKQIVLIELIRHISTETLIVM